MKQSCFCSEGLYRGRHHCNSHTLSQICWLSLLAWEGSWTHSSHQISSFSLFNSWLTCVFSSCQRTQLLLQVPGITEVGGCGGSERLIQDPPHPCGCHIFLQFPICPHSPICHASLFFLTTCPPDFRPNTKNISSKCTQAV